MLTYYNHRPLRGFCLPCMSYIHIVLNIILTLYEGWLYSISAQNGYLWKIVLLTLAASRGVTDLYPS